MAVFLLQVADFGLAKIASDTDTHISTRVMGTFGQGLLLPLTNFLAYVVSTLWFIVIIITTITITIAITVTTTIMIALAITSIIIIIIINFLLYLLNL